MTVAKMSLPEISFCAKEEPGDLYRSLLGSLFFGLLRNLAPLSSRRQVSWMRGPLEMVGGAPGPLVLKYELLYKDLYISLYFSIFQDIYFIYCWWCYHDHRGFAQGINTWVPHSWFSIPNSPSLERCGRKRTLPYSDVATTHPIKITNIYI